MPERPAVRFASTMEARRLAAGCAVLVGLCHLSWISEGLSSSTLPSRTSYVSELMALDQPWSTGMRLVDAIAGILLLIAVVGSWRATRHLRRTVTTRPRRAIWVAHLGFAVFGLATVADVASPMSCAPSVSQACAAAEAAGTLPLHHTIHSVTSSLATGGALVGTVAVAVAAWCCRAPGHIVASLAATGYLLTTIWVLVEIAGATIGSPLQGLVGLDARGWSQRTQVTCSALSVMVAAGVMVVNSRTKTP